MITETIDQSREKNRQKERIEKPTGKRKQQRGKIRPDWWRKSFAGAVLGLSLALALSGLFAWLGPGGIDAPDKRQFVMWSIPPLWVSVFSLAYLFRSGNRALLWLGGANALAYGLLIFVKEASVA